ncbi:hypothetical protein GCM10020331_031280 [Ectobacillus funiculus]
MMYSFEKDGRFVIAELEALNPEKFKVDSLIGEPLDEDRSVAALTLYS